MSHKDRPYGEFKRAKPPTFDGEIKTGQEVEAWLLGIKNYFWMHEYTENEKAKIAIFNLNGRAAIWWEHLRQVKGLSERKIEWRKFEKYFKQKYLSERYFDSKRK